MNNMYKFKLPVLLCTAYLLPLWAGPIDPPEDDDPHPDPVPIDDFIPYLFLTAICIGMICLIYREIKMIKEFPCDQ